MAFVLREYGDAGDPLRASVASLDDKKVGHLVAPFVNDVIEVNVPLAVLSGEAAALANNSRHSHRPVGW